MTRLYASAIRGASRDEISVSSMDSKDTNAARLDRGFKTVIHDSDVLSWMLKNSVDELKDRTIEEIKTCLDIEPDGHTVIGKETEYPSSESGTIVTDSVFEVRIPDTEHKVSVIVNIEGQNNPSPGYPLEKRAEYYMARLVSSQKSVDFKNDDYSNLRKTYSIWFILGPRAKDRNTVTRYRMKAENLVGSPERAIPEMETFNIVMINVGRYDSTLPDVSAFPAALFSKMEDDERQNLMKDRFNIRLDEFISREVKEMASIGQDTYNWGFSEGSEKGQVITAAKIVINLICQEGWTLDKALAVADLDESIRPLVEEEVRKNLDL